MGIVFHHLAAHVTGDCHDGGIASFGFRQLRDGEVPEIMEAKTTEGIVKLGDETERLV